MRHLREYCTANTISPNFSRRKGTTTMSSSQRRWSAQPPQFQRHKIAFEKKKKKIENKTMVCGYNDFFFPFFCLMSVCFFLHPQHYDFYMVKGWQNLVRILAHQESWQCSSSVCLSYGLWNPEVVKLTNYCYMQVS